MTIVVVMLAITSYPIISAAAYPIYKRLGGHLSFEAYMNNL